MGGGGGGVRTAVSRDRVLGISVNTPIKALPPPMCIPSVCSKSCFYTFGRIHWFGLAREEGGGIWHMESAT